MFLRQSGPKNILIDLMNGLCWTQPRSVSNGRILHEFQSSEHGFCFLSYVDANQFIQLIYAATQPLLSSNLSCHFAVQLTHSSMSSSLRYIAIQSISFSNINQGI